MKKILSETQDLISWLGSVKRSPKQTHKIGESDAEVIKLAPKLFLATTIDSISEEIAYRLYQDPFTMGWVTAMASLSDLAAVGVDPQGFLFSAQWDHHFSTAMKAEVARGLKSALAKCKVPLLGGDTGSAVSTLLSGVATGTSTEKPLSRIGAKPGDIIFITGPIGIGPALAFQHVLGGENEVISESDYRPVAQLEAGKRLRPFSTCAMDMSDGFAVTLQTLCTLNGVNAELQWNESWFAKKAIAWCRKKSMPLSSLCFGEHGDFQLVICVPARHAKKAQSLVHGLIPIGKIVRAKKPSSIYFEKEIPIRFDLMADAPKDSLESFKRAVEKIADEMKRLELP